MHRITTGKVRLEFDEVDLAEIVRATVDSMVPVASEKGIRIRNRIENAAGKISGDSARLQQVLRNLLGNAVKFTPKGGEIRVGLKRSGASVQVQVRDTGEGISAQVLPLIFERFRQADPLASHAHGGLGLGLAIAKQLVELHGGTICAESAGKGAGCDVHGLAAAARGLALSVASLLSMPPHTARVSSEVKKKQGRGANACLRR